MKAWHALITVFLVTVLRLTDPFLVESSRLSFFDFLQRSKELNQSEQIVLIDIDETALARFGQFPFPRNILADELKKIDDSVIGINIVMSEPDRAGGDLSLTDVLRDTASVLAISSAPMVNTNYRPLLPGLVEFGEISLSSFVGEQRGMIFALPQFMEVASGFGVVDSTLDSDGIIRRIPLLTKFEDKFYPSFALDILRVAAADNTFQVKTDEAGLVFVRIPRYNTISTDRVGNLNVAYWNDFQRYSLTEIEQVPPGSIAILGATFAGSTIVSTPVGSMYPHDVQANVLKTLIDGVTLKRPSDYLIYEIIITFVLSIFLIFMLSRAPIFLSGALFLIFCGSLVICSTNFFNKYNMMLDPTFPLMGLFLAFTHSSFIQFYQNLKQKQLIKGQFSTYLSPQMVDALSKDPSLLKLGGERKEMTFLFMDICGFTPISEHYKNRDDPEGLVLLINDYLDKMTSIILKHGGTIDKYMGDCIMAFWNAPLACSNHAEMAVRAAKEIEVVTKDLQQVYSQMGLPEIRVGTGINTGDCIVGNMGSTKRFDYSVIGDAVNLAARLEATAARGKYENVPTIYSSYTAQQLPPYVKSKKIGEVQVKGKSEVIEIYSFQ